MVSGLVIQNAQIGDIFTDEAQFRHKDHTTSDGVGFMHTKLGEAHVNAKAGQRVFIGFGTIRDHLTVETNGDVKVKQAKDFSKEVIQSVQALSKVAEAFQMAVMKELPIQY
jgi:hypothetical protein